MSRLVHAPPEPLAARVPWVARWSQEVDRSPLRVRDGQLGYPDGDNPRVLGALWMRERNDRRGEGLPQFGEVSTTRQLLCMLDRRCQVCSGVLPAGPVTWLLPAVEVRALRISGKPFTTTTPPVCADCLPVALKHCPNLSSQPPLKLRVFDFRPWGIWGEIVGPDGRGHRKAEIQLDDPRLPLAMARQLIVQIYNYRRLR